MHSLPFSLPGFEITEVISTAEQLIICATSRSVQAECPACHEASQRVHSYYHRSPQDLPVSGQAVQLRLRVRRFRCLNARCAKKTFAEPLPDLIAPIARRTNRLTLLLHVFAIQSGGEPGAWLLKAGGTKVSPDTLLRLAKAEMAQKFAVPSMLGVDDFAFRRGLTHGTLLIDWQHHSPIDLLAVKRDYFCMQTAHHLNKERLACRGYSDGTVVFSLTRLRSPGPSYVARTFLK